MLHVFTLNQLNHILSAAPIMANDSAIAQMQAEPFLPARGSGVFIQPDIDWNTAHGPPKLRFAFSGVQIAFSYRAA
ncbi:hypothetical protein D3C76_1248890 [compost metagenome]